MRMISPAPHPTSQMLSGSTMPLRVRSDWMWSAFQAESSWCQLGFWLR
jgi:hypothetical protein